MDGMLSQDEINALLSGMGSGGDDAESTGTATVTDTPDNNSAEDSFTLTESEKDAVGEISNISMGTAATTLSSDRKSTRLNSSHSSQSRMPSSA